MYTGLTILRTYAGLPDPGVLPDAIRLTHTDCSLTVFDAYPKGVYHFLLLPRILAPLRAAQMTDLQTLLQHLGTRDGARAFLQRLRADADAVVRTVRAEMVKEHGTEWPIQVGFHALPSMEHVHLHIVSSDLAGENIKKKVHFNSFHPEKGFFLHLDDVLSWCDLDDVAYAKVRPFLAAPRTQTELESPQKIKFNKPALQAILKSDMLCVGCKETMKTVRTALDHVKMHWRLMLKAKGLPYKSAIDPKESAETEALEDAQRDAETAAEAEALAKAQDSATEVESADAGSKRKRAALEEAPEDGEAGVSAQPTAKRRENIRLG
ncbi:uncharacterized protein BXZ73DRAFT_36981 [Epithele typhae]|uniref:uncharacterized protein n=1 Tax=Epithele typhae TaxID=378194 RepID=UPI002008652F|nr:uncharacterized protein BXZ73DRAFT_36981 [Epithele typhae]KAH9946085.1 hypothetical protein BXZ73DRAFT_36981 [Epithele typhae]